VFWLAVLSINLGVVETCRAAVFDGEVVEVVDGDTVTVQDDRKVRYRIRLAGIDAPESNQVFGTASRQNLQLLVGGRAVTVTWHKRDKYGRIVGVIHVQERDINLEQIRSGFAWHYRRYAHEQSAEDRELYSQAEQEARSQRLGLWEKPNPVPPWEWRRR